MVPIHCLHVLTFNTNVLNQYAMARNLDLKAMDMGKEQEPYKAILLITGTFNYIPISYLKIKKTTLKPNFLTSVKAPKL